VLKDEVSGLARNISVYYTKQEIAQGITLKVYNILNDDKNASPRTNLSQSKDGINLNQINRETINTHSGDKFIFDSAKTYRLS
jgi:hypothetical protein